MRTHRTWKQVGLRTALVAITGACLLAWYLGLGRRQQSAARAIERAGGKVAYAYQCDANGSLRRNAQPSAPKWVVRLLGVDATCRLTKVHFDHAEPDDGIFRPLVRLPHLEHLSLQYTAVTDTGIASLRKLPKLRTLDLYHTKVTDAGLAHLTALARLEELRLGEMRVTGISFHFLRQIESLRTLNIESSWVTNNGLRHLRHHPNLRKLHLYYSEVDDAGLSILKDLPRLEYVSLGRMDVSDAGLKHLHKCKNLKRLDIFEATRITKNGVIALRNAIPGCQVHFDPP